MTDRIIRNDYELDQVVKLIKHKGYPLTLSIRKGEERTVEQNKLQRMWLNEASEQLGDQTPEELRGLCKLTIGVPIMRAAREDFRQKYDDIIKPHSYEEKIAMMMEPLDFPVTRLMKSKEKAEYLDKMYCFFTEQGIMLTEPNGNN